MADDYDALSRIFAVGFWGRGRVTDGIMMWGPLLWNGTWRNFCRPLFRSADVLGRDDECIQDGLLLFRRRRCCVSAIFHVTLERNLF